MDVTSRIKESHTEDLPGDFAAHTDFFTAMSDLVPKIRLRLMREYRLPSHLKDDLEQSGYLALIEARSRVRAAHKSELRSFASIRIRGAMLDYLRKHYFGNSKRTVSYDLMEEEAGSGGASLQGENRLASNTTPEDSLNRRQRQRIVEQQVALLPAREQSVISEYYFHGKKLKEIAGESIGIPALSKIHRKALFRMSKRMLSVDVGLLSDQSI